MLLFTENICDDFVKCKNKAAGFLEWCITSFSTSVMMTVFLQIGGGGGGGGGGEGGEGEEEEEEREGEEERGAIVLLQCFCVFAGVMC